MSPFASRVASVLAIALVSCTDQPTSLLDDDTTSSGPGSGGAPQGGASSSSGAGASGGGGSGGAEVQPASFTLSAAPISLELRDAVDASVDIAPNGYVGEVALAVAGGPADVMVELGQASVTLDGATTASVPFTVTTLSNTASGAFVVTLVGSVPAGDRSVDAVLTIEPAITITIPPNLSSFSSNPANTTAFGDFPTVLKALPNMSADNPITVRFFNADTVPHEIHADDPAQGFPHGNQSIPPGSFDPVVRMINSPGEYLYYPHDIGLSILGRIDIE